MQEMVAINILIGDRSYRIKIAPADEEAVRKVVKTISDKIVDFKTQFGGKDMQDYLAMVLVWLATHQNPPSKSELSTDDLMSRLEAMESALDKVLDSK